MLIGIVDGATGVLRGPPEMGEDCADLHVRHALEGQYPVMISAWIPTPEELLRLSSGAPVHLCVYGRAHPPVWVGVGDAPVARAAGDSVAAEAITVAEPGMLRAGNDDRDAAANPLL